MTSGWRCGTIGSVEEKRIEKELRVRISGALLRELKIEAIREDRSVPEVVRALITQWLKEKGIEVE